VRRAYNRGVDTDTRYAALTLTQFGDHLASGEPAPGGGSASAVAGSLAASLVAMVAALSQGRPKFAEHEQLLDWANEEGTHLNARLLAIADEDAAAYTRFSNALKLPKDSEAEQATRREAMRLAARHAAEVPLDCVDACLRVVRAAEAIAGRSNANASSDLNVAALLGEAAARGAAANVLVNLPSVGDDAFASDATARVEHALAEIERLADSTRAVVESGERRPPLPGPPSG
jgi:formiminotetrahydrofolate cyclodeaminase